MRNTRQASEPRCNERGMSVIELMVALAVIAVGLLAVAQLFPAGTRAQQKDKMFTTANMLANEQLEDLRAIDWSHADMLPGAHGPDSVGPNNAYVVNYTVTSMAAPMDLVKRVDVTVNYTSIRPRSVTATTYIRR